MVRLKWHRARRMLVALLAVMLPLVPLPATAVGWSPVVDEPADYEPQNLCRSTPLPGTQALASWLMRSYPATGSMGLIRGCTVGGTSEHKDGRAFDWAADVAKPRQRKAAYRFINRALATDAKGNANALARRLGIMYFIFNDTIWSSYRDFAPRPYLNSGCPTKKRCSRSLRHLNHVHISLGYAGASAQTSWYRSRGIGSLPVFFPGTKQLDPDRTAVTTLSVPASGKAVTSSFVLKAGVTYRFVATGTVRHGSGKVGDAHCVAESADASAATAWTPTDRLPLEVPLLPDEGQSPWWIDQPGSEQDDSPAALPVLATRGLGLAGALRWGETCRADHTYQAWFTPLVNRKLTLQYVDTVGSDNAGSLTVHVARDDITAASLARR